MNDFKLDLERIRARAREDLQDGPVTSAYGADRTRVIDVLNAALATEIVCNLRYRSHHHMARGMHAEAVAAELKEHADEENQHAEMIATRIAQLGGVPDLNPRTLSERSHAEYGCADELREALRQDLVAERIAISTYMEIIRWLGDSDPTTRRILEDILATEEEHADDLASLLARVPQ